MERAIANLYLVMSEMLTRDILREPKYDDPKRLDRFGFKGNSQTDEDGILQEIYNRIGMTDKRFIEFGAGGGEYENNTIYLLKKGWTGLWFEGNKKKHALITAKYNTPRIKIAPEFVTKDNINVLFKKYGFTGEIDLLSIDIDGNDYWVWKAVNIVNPRVIIMEYNAKYAPPMEWVMAHNPNHKFDKTDQMGASLTSLTKLGDEQGYKLVGCTISGANAFFVRNDLVGDHFCAPYTAENHYHKARYYLAKDTGLMNYHYSGMRHNYGPYVGENGVLYK